MLLSPLPSERRPSAGDEPVALARAMAVELRRLLVLLLVLLLIRQSARVAAQQCASVACYRDDCVDAAANAPELGGAATCEAAVLLATAAGGCTVESNSLDPSLPPGAALATVP